MRSRLARALEGDHACGDVVLSRFDDPVESVLSGTGDRGSRMLDSVRWP